MHLSSMKTRLNPVFKTIGIITLILLFSTLPVFGAVRSAQARVLNDVEDIITHRRANFQTGDILGTPLVSLTIRNGAGDAYLLMKLKIQFGGNWSTESAEVSLIKMIPSNQNFTFTNTDMLSYVSNVRMSDIVISAGLKTKLGIETYTDVANMNSLPEGVYTVSLTASEVTLSNPADIESTYTVITNWITESDPGASVEFKVVNIGSINIIETPTIGKLSLTFQVPEIPIYNETNEKSTSTTKIQITGTGVNYSATKQHARSMSNSSTLKGYPSDTDNGYVTYDLSAVPFRAGQNYSVVIDYLDWNNASIASRTIPLNSFPTPQFTTAVDTSSPYQPLFSWSFGTSTDYSSWIKEYQIYLNGSYFGFTTNDEFQSSTKLLPGTTYSWYVMPKYKDGTDFLSLGSIPAKSFTTKTHTNLDVEILEPAGNAKLFVNESYRFSGNATFYDGATQRTATWSIGSDFPEGLSTNYTPTRRYASNSLPVFIKIVDTLGLSKTSPTINLTVLDPSIALAGTATRTVDRGSASRFQVDTSNTRDIASYEWFVDNSSVGTSNELNHTFDTSGNHTVFVRGLSPADLNGNTKIVQSTTTTVTVVGAGPSVSISQPSSTVDIILGTQLEITATIGNENSLKEILWTFTSPSGATQTLVTTGAKVAYKPTAAGEYTVAVSVTDIYGKNAQASVRILVVNPVVNVTSPAIGSVFSLTSSLTPVIQAPFADRVLWFINDTQISSDSYALSNLSPGTYSLYARAYWNVVDALGKPTEYYKDSAKVSFTVKNLTPPKTSITFPSEGMQLKTGQTYRLVGEVDSASTVSQEWWEVDGTRLSGTNYTPAANLTKKLVTITHSAINSDGIKGSDSVTVRMANPAVYLNAPAASSFLVGSIIPINATAVDAELIWLVDDVKTPNWDKTFSQTGIHKVKALWSMEAVEGSSSSLKVFEGSSAEVPFTIYSDQKPVFVTTSPANPFVVEATGRNLSFNITASSANTLQPTTWRKVMTTGTTEIGQGNSLTLALDTPDLFTIQAVVTDNHGLSSSKDWTVKVIAPAVGITSPENGTTYALRAVPTPIVTTKDVSSYTLVLDGRPLASDFNWNNLAVGAHTLSVEGVYTVTSATTPQKVTSNTVSFSVQDQTPPNFTLQGLADGDRIIAGQLYSLVVASQNGATIEVFKNGTKLNASGAAGDTFNFTPTAAERRITLQVRGKLNNITVDKTIGLTVLDPAIAIKLPLAVNGLYPSSTPIALQYEGRDLDLVTWYVNGKVSTAQALSFASGNHTLGAVGTANGVRLPDKSYGNHTAAGSGTASQTITVARQIAITDLQSVDTLYTGNPLALTVTTTGDENNGLIASLTFTVDGQVYREEKAPVAKTISITGLTAGPHTLGVIATDVFGNRVTKEKAVTVYRPLSIAITQPAQGARISPDTNVTVSLALLSGQAQRIVWKIDGNTVASSNFTSGSLGRLQPGTHTISATATDILGTEASASVGVEVQSDFQLNLLAPTAPTQILINNNLTCMVGVDKVAGSSVNLTDAAQFITWYVDGSSTGRTGLTYVFTGTVAGNHTVQARYSKDGMVRMTAEQTISVRDIAQPTISKPLNGSTITYSMGENLALWATGEPGASFSWMIGGKQVAMGSETTFSPNGMTGPQLLQLVTTAFGRTKTQIVSFNLVLNNPPTINLTAPPIQFTEEKLTWTASVFDVEDKDDLPRIEYLLDGIALDAQSRVLTANDIGMHTLVAKATDKNKVTVSKQVGITVEALKLPIQIQSPRADETYFKAFDLQLVANQVSGGGAALANGTFTWTLQYLDYPSAPAQTFTGSSVVFKPTNTGTVAITVRLTDGNGKNRGSQSTSIMVKEVPLELSIYWPHGSIVNAGQALAPQLLGLPADAAQGTLTWTMDGKVVENIATLTAPMSPGIHELKALYNKAGSTGSETDRAEITFTVNGNPSIAILNPVTGTQAVVGNPLLLSAKVTDDQSYEGKIQWKDQTNTVLGEGNPFVLANPAVGDLMLTALVEDRYGAKGQASSSVRVYTPISAIVVTIHNNLSTYLVAQNALPLPVKASFTGGIMPEVQWILRQGSLEVLKTGAEASFPYAELAPFAKTGASITCVILDSGITDPASREVFRKEYPIQLTGEATAQVVLPAAETRLWVGEPVQLGLALTGFNKPSFLMTINGVQAATSWGILEDTALFGTTLPQAALTAEGVYELSVTITENGVTKLVPITLNLYQPRKGVFVDNAPALFDIEGPAVLVEAVVVGLGEGSVLQWKTDLASAPVGSGPSLNLSTAGLTPGDRSITVEAISGTTVLASHTFLLKVSGPMQMQVTPDETLLIVQQGAPVTLMATGADKNGAPFGKNAFSWTSHLDGLLKTKVGAEDTLDFSDNPALSIGEHLITIRATGKDGTSISIMRRVEIKSVAPQQEDTGSDGLDGSQTPGDDKPSQEFTLGRNIPPPPPGGNNPIGPDGKPADEDLLSAADKYILDTAKTALTAHPTKHQSATEALADMKRNLETIQQNMGTSASVNLRTQVRNLLNSVTKVTDKTQQAATTASTFNEDTTNLQNAKDFLAATQARDKDLGSLQISYVNFVNALPADYAANIQGSTASLLLLEAERVKVVDGIIKEAGGQLQVAKDAYRNASRAVSSTLKTALDSAIKQAERDINSAKSEITKTQTATRNLTNRPTNSTYLTNAKKAWETRDAKVAAVEASILSLQEKTKAVVDVDAGIIAAAKAEKEKADMAFNRIQEAKISVQTTEDVIKRVSFIIPSTLKTSLTNAITQAKKDIVAAETALNNANTAATNLAKDPTRASYITALNSASQARDAAIVKLTASIQIMELRTTELVRIDETIGKLLSAEASKVTWARGNLDGAIKAVRDSKTGLSRASAKVPVDYKNKWSKAITTAENDIAAAEKAIIAAAAATKSLANTPTNATLKTNAESAWKSRNTAVQKAIDSASETEGYLNQSALYR